VLNLKGCTALKPSAVRRVFLSDASPASAALKLDVRGCPALFSIQHEFPHQVRFRRDRLCELSFGGNINASAFKISAVA
jgi:hypothetical protein